jgi:putative ABC transport system permease protein
VVSLDRVTAAPYLLATLLIVLTLATLAMNLIASVRERVHDLAVMRALGADRRQLRSLVHWHAMTIALIGLVIAVPVGSLLGGRVFTLVADNVGVVSSPLVSPLLLAVVAGGVLVIANVVALWPGRRAGRPPADALRRS